MARSLATALASQLDAKELKPFYALEFGFDSGSLYLWTGLGELYDFKAGFIDYEIWSTHAGNGSTSQYPGYPTDAINFKKWFNQRFTNSVFYSSGISPISVILDFQTLSTLTNNQISIPNNGEYFAILASGIFVPKETGIYTFTSESDDSVDLFINNINVVSFYGGRPTSNLGTTTGTVSLIAGVPYSFRVRTQEYAGGEGLRIFWKKPSQSGGIDWFQDINELGIGSGNTWIGGAGVIGISTSSETIDLSANNVTITLNGLDSSVLAIALAEPYRGRPFTLYLGALDSENQSVGTMYQLFSGRMDTMSVEDNGSTANISLVVENALIDLERPRIRRLTNEEQLARFPGDLSLSGVAKLQDRQISWGRA